jgi:hypothetical protein
MVESVMREFKRRDDWVCEVNKILRENNIERQFIFPELKNFYQDYPNAHQAAVKIAHEFHLGVI